MVGTQCQPIARHLRDGARLAAGRAGVAQTGQVRGKVVDAENKPVEGAKVTLCRADNNRKFELKTKKNGEYMQIGLSAWQLQDHRREGRPDSATKTAASAWTWPR